MEEEVEVEEIQQEHNKKERLFVIIILILIAIFVILYLLISYLGIIEHRPKIPTGNVDIFEIIFGGSRGRMYILLCM